jgi:hypothetical protein
MQLGTQYVCISPPPLTLVQSRWILGPEEADAMGGFFDDSVVGVEHKYILCNLAMTIPHQWHRPPHNVWQAELDGSSELPGFRAGSNRPVSPSMEVIHM